MYINHKNINILKTTIQDHINYTDLSNHFIFLRAIILVLMSKVLTDSNVIKSINWIVQRIN